MDFSTLSPYLGPVGVAALLALYGLASLAKSNSTAQRDNAELFARLRSVGVITELPSALGTLSYETLAWYMSAM